MTVSVRYDIGAADDQLYGNDIILAGAGNSLADGDSGDDVRYERLCNIIILPIII